MTPRRWYATFICLAAEAVEGNVLFCGQHPVEVGLAADQAELDGQGGSTIKATAPCPTCGNDMMPLGVASVH